jgi:tRNA(Ile)-lysidine synthase
MASFSPQALAQVLESTLPANATQLCVAFSGGLDSTVLLHALHALRASHPHWSVRALHIDHQLQSSSALWSQECARIASQLEIPYACRRVHVTGALRSGPESAARTARYDAFARDLATEEVLLTAHHADDQLETVLLALVRGSGVAGVAAMPSCTVFAAGFHLRPLLNFTRAELESWAVEQRVVGVQDPTNADVRFDRNFLRHAVIPVLKERWPSVARTVTRSATHFADADQLLDELAATDLAHASCGACLQVAALRLLSSRRRRNLLRYWVHRGGFLMPSTRKLMALERDMLAARADSVPCVTWDGAEVRRYDDLLYLLKPSLAQLPTKPITWDVREELRLPDELGSLRSVRARGGGLSCERLPQDVQVRFRQGGEQLKPRHARHHRTLKYCLGGAIAFRSSMQTMN